MSHVALFPESISLKWVKSNTMSVTNDPIEMSEFMVSVCDEDTLGAKSIQDLLLCYFLLSYIKFPCKPIIVLVLFYNLELFQLQILLFPLAYVHILKILLLFPLGWKVTLVRSEFF